MWQEEITGFSILSEGASHWRIACPLSGGGKIEEDRGVGKR